MAEANGWRVEPEAPPIKRGRKLADPDIGQMIAEAVKSGSWLSKSYPTRRAALRAAQRIRYAAEAHHVGLTVSRRVTPEGDQFKLSVLITRELRA